MKTAFDFQIRVVACDVCGAPVALGEAGGAQACAYCSNEQAAGTSSRAVQRAQTIPEPQRIEGLRHQDRNPIEAPQPIADLFVGVALLPWKVSEALGRWQLLRGRAKDLRDHEAERQLHRLTLALAVHFGDRSDLMRERALLEGGLEAVEGMRYRQSLIGALARSACRVGDLPAAEAWLALCDPTPVDLMADSAYRFSLAMVETLKQRFEVVLRVLGQRNEVPIDNEHDAACAVLRANALERLGRTPEAIDSLAHFYQHGSALMRHLAGRFLTQYADWQLCAQSARPADARQQERGAAASGRAAGRPFLIWGIVATMLIVGLAVAIPLGIFVGTGPAHLTFGIVGLMVVAIGVIGAFDTRKAIRARRLRQRGVAELARVVHARHAGQETMGVPQLLYRVLVLPTKGTPFTAHSMFHADHRDRARFGPGALVVVRLDPERRGDVQFELD